MLLGYVFFGVFSGYSGTICHYSTYLYSTGYFKLTICIQLDSSEKGGYPWALACAGFRTQIRRAQVPPAVPGGRAANKVPQPPLHYTTHAQCFTLAPPPPCMRILLHLHRTARPSHSAACPTGTAQMHCILTLCAPPGCRTFFAVSRGAVESGAQGCTRVRTYFCAPIFIVAAWHF